MHTGIALAALTLALAFTTTPALRLLQPSSCVTDVNQFCSTLAHGQYPDPCDPTCNAYINCWDSGVNVKQT